MSETNDKKECPEGQVFDEESGECVPIKNADLGLTQRIEGVVKDYFSKLETNLTKMIDDKLKTLVKAKETEVEQALRKSFGLEKDPVIHASELPGLIRRLQVENAELGKQTPTGATDETGPEGNKALLKSKSLGSARAKEKAELNELWKSYSGEDK